MLRVIRPQLRPYSIAIITSAIAGLLTWCLEPVMRPSFFTLFYPAVMVSSLYGGLRPGLLSVALAALITKYFFLPPVHSLAFSNANSLFRFSLLVLVALMICLMSKALRTAKQRIEASLLKLQKSEQKYRRIVETANEGIWWIDGETRTTYVNSRMAQMLGYTPTEMLGRSAFEFIYETDWAEAQRRIEQRKQGIGGNSEFCLRRKDGSPIWIQSNTTPMLDDNGECVGILSMVTDISDAYRQATQRKRAEQRLRFQYAVTRVLAEANTLADAVPTILQSLCESLGWQMGRIWSVDRQANVMHYVESWSVGNVNAQEFAQASQDTTFTPGIGLPGRIWTSGQPAWIANLSEDDNFPRAALAARAGLRAAFGFPILLEKEILGVIECFNDKIQEPDADLLQMMANIGSQIGQFMERKRAEEELANSQQLFLSFMTHIPGAAYIKDEQGRYIYANPTVENVLERKLVDLVGKTNFDLIPAVVARQIQENDIAVLAAGKPLEMLETLPQEDGEHYWMSFKFPFKDASGKQIVAGMSFDVTDRKRTEEALRKNEQWLKLALDTAKLGSWQLDFQTGVLSGSDQCKVNLGLPLDAEFSQQTVVEAIHPDDRNRFQEATERAIANQTDYEVEYRAIWPDGSIHWIVTRGRAMYDPDGSPLRLVGVCLDISDRKQTEDALRASENLYRTLSEAVPDFVWSCDAQGQLDFVNSRWLEYAGMTVEELNAGGVEQIYHPADFSWVMQQWNQCLQKQEPLEAECRYRRKDGVYRWFMVRAVPLQDAQGNIVKWIGTTTDIHERKQAEQALREQEERLSTALWASATGTYRWDIRTNALDWDENLNRLCGLPEGATVRQIEEFVALIHPDERESVVAQMQHCIQSGWDLDMEFRVIWPDGSLHWLLDKGKTVFDEQGNPLYMTGACLDVTERKQTTEALSRSEERLRVALKNSPVSVFNHDRELRYIWKYNAMFDHDVKAVIGKRDIDLLPEDDAEVLTRIKRQVIETGVGAREEIKITLQGQDWYYDLTVEPLRDAKNKVIGVTCAAVNITEYKQTEIALRNSETVLNALLASSPVAIAFLDQNLRYIHVNEALAAINGLPLSEHRGRTLWEVLPDGAPRLAPILQQVMETQQPLLNQELSGEANPPGIQRHCLDNYYPVCLPDGQILGVGISSMDVTERKRTEQAQQYLIEASRILSSSLDYQTILTNLAHLAVPQLADWSTVHLIEENGSVQPLATVHVNPDKIVWAQQLHEKYPFDPDAPRGLANVLRTGQSEFYPDIPDQLLVEAALDAEHLQILREVGFSSAIIVPMLVRGRTLGAISFITAESGRRYDPTDLALAEELAHRAALAVENARLYQQAQQARQKAEQAAERTARLQAVTAAFSEALTANQVAEVVVNQGIAALGIRAGFVALLTDNDTSLEIVQSVGLPQELLESWRHFPITAPVPIAELVRTGKPIFLESVEAFATQYPILAHAPMNTGNKAFACIPVTVEGQILGGISFSFAESKAFNQEDRAFMLTLGYLCGQAIVRARLYEAEQGARRDAETANRIKDEFLAVLSHELRSPLNPILGWTKLLRSRKFDAQATDRALETIERNAKLQTQLIEDLLDVSRILRGKLALNVAPVNLVTTIEAAMETVRLAAQAKDIQIETMFEPNVGQVSGDANRLQQVIWNLLSNAIKFTPQGGRVEVRLSTDCDGKDCNLNSKFQYAQIQVKDTGKGISPKFLPYVFEYFRQENSSTTRQFGGLGLGLAIVRYLTELHGGSVRADSLGEGLGATFTVRLPLMVAQEEAPQEVMRSISSVNLNGLHILIVDDEADIRELVAFILEQSGAIVSVAASAEEALLALDKSVPDILLSDIGMPDVDGYMLIRQVRELFSQREGQVPGFSAAMPKAIALTAYAGEYNQQQAIQAGFQLHIPKPVEPEELINAIARLAEFEFTD